MTNLEKLRAGIVKIPCSCGKPGCVLQLREETNALMRQAADEIEGLRRENARLQELNKRLFDDSRGRLADKPTPGGY